MMLVPVTSGVVSLSRIEIGSCVIRWLWQASAGWWLLDSLIVPFSQESPAVAIND